MCTGALHMTREVDNGFKRRGGGDKNNILFIAHAVVKALKTQKEYKKEMSLERQVCGSAGVYFLLSSVSVRFTDVQDCS